MLHDLVSLRRVIGRTAEGQELVKPRLGCVTDVGKKGCLVRFEDDPKHPQWQTQGSLWFYKSEHGGGIVLTKERPPAAVQPMTALPEKYPVHVEEEDEDPEVAILPPASVDASLKQPTPVPNKIAALISAGVDPWAMWQEMGRSLLSHEEEAVTAATAELEAAQAARKEAEEMLHSCDNDVTKAGAKLNQAALRLAELKRRVTG